MTEVSKGDFIRWTFEDEEGESAHFNGQVTKAKADGEVTRITMRFDGGTVEFDSDDGKIEHIKKPKNWKKEEKESAPEKKVNAQGSGKPSAPKKKEPKGKLLEVINLLKNNVPNSRKDAIKRIVDAGIMGEAGASTYWNNAKPHLGL